MPRLLAARVSARLVFFASRAPAVWPNCVMFAGCLRRCHCAHRLAFASGVCAAGGLDAAGRAGCQRRSHTVCATVTEIPFVSHLLFMCCHQMHGVGDASASLRLTAVRPACSYDGHKTRRCCPGSILQLLFTIGMTWRSPWSNAGLHTKHKRLCHPCDQLRCAHAACYGT